MKLKRIASSALAALLLLALTAGAPGAALAEVLQAEVKSGSMRVYTVQSPHRYMGALSKGTQVTVERYANGIAQISYRGRTGLCYTSDLKKVEALPEVLTPLKEVVTLEETRVYKQRSTLSGYWTLKAGTTLSLVAIDGSIATVQKNGYTGYTFLSNLGDVGSALEPAATLAPTPTPALEVTPTPSPTPAAQEIVACDIAVVTTRSTKVYQRATTQSPYTLVPAGTALTLTAYQGNIAMVKKGSAVGYMALSALERAPEATLAPTPTPTPTPAPVSEFSNTSYQEPAYSAATYEKLIYRFLVSEIGLNKAAACGVLANMKYESDYMTTCVGDGGTSYGLTQWHAGRMTTMINWCESNGYDYKTLRGQLYYLKYELPAKFPSVYKFLKGVEDSPQGAYDAAYHFCYYYEIPANRASGSVKRGNYARDTLYPKYAG